MNRLPLFLYMLHTHIDDGFDVVVVQGINDRFALLAVFDQPCVFQHAELVGDCRHTHAQLFGNVANAHLTVKQEIEDLDSSAVAHDREKFGEREEMLVVGQSDLIYDFVVRFVLAADRRVVVCMFHDGLLDLMIE